MTIIILRSNNILANILCFNFMQSASLQLHVIHPFNLKLLILPNINPYLIVPWRTAKCVGQFIERYRWLLTKDNFKYKSLLPRATWRTTNFWEYSLSMNTEHVKPLRRNGQSFKHLAKRPSACQKTWEGRLCEASGQHLHAEALCSNGNKEQYILATETEGKK